MNGGSPAGRAGASGAEADADLPTVGDLEELSDLVSGDGALYVRWSRGPSFDEGTHSRDELTGADLPGLCANPLAVEDWWGDRPVDMWVARRLYDYRHLRELRGPGVRPWILQGEELGRGPDNEPIVRCLRPVAWISEDVVHRAETAVEAANEDWGTLRRRA